MYLTVHRSPRSQTASHPLESELHSFECCLTVGAGNQAWDLCKCRKCLTAASSLQPETCKFLYDLLSVTAYVYINVT